ncbi:hypothetical protein Q31a_51840 [Aureliella helgolandensis]|uniref:Uncharacterized protein n=1 Tax=Aureliella helgolandensis TaxID=2527968 RepID=A0A518GDX6_9BACT|nr:hypothetical protein Q31a_51840 [Aureliella helgolandensis]
MRDDLRAALKHLEWRFRTEKLGYFRLATNAANQASVLASTRKKVGTDPMEQLPRKNSAKGDGH